MNKKYIVFSIVLILILIVIGVFFLTSKKEKDDNKITLVTEAQYAPYEYYENNEIVGVDIDIAKEIAKELGKELEIKDVEFSQILNEIKFDKGDFAAAGLTITDERKEEVDFSEPYIDTKLVAIVLDNDKINNLDDLHGKILSTIPGSACETAVFEKYDDVELLGSTTMPIGVENVKAGKADFTVMDDDSAKGFVDENPQLKILEEPIAESYSGIALKKGNTKLAEQINTVIKKLKEEGKIKEFLDKYTNK